MAVVFVVLALLIASVLLWLCSGRERRRIAREKERLGVPHGKIIYTDLDKPAQPLFSPSLGLVGKPDYIVRAGGMCIPVEVKSAKTRKPYKNHVLQLAAYCMLVEEAYDQPVPFGVLAYDAGRQFKIPFTAVLREEVSRALEQMRTQLVNRSTERNHNLSARCKSCPFSNFCDQRIA